MGKFFPTLLLRYFFLSNRSENFSDVAIHLSAAKSCFVSYRSVLHCRLKFVQMRLSVIKLKLLIIIIDVQIFNFNCSLAVAQLYRDSLLFEFTVLSN